MRIKQFLCLAMVWTWPVLAQGDRARLKDRGVSGILTPGKPWELLGEGYQLTADSAVDAEGNVYFTDARKNRIMKIDRQGTIRTWKDGSNGAHGVAIGPDGRLYAGQHDRKRIVVYSADGGESTIVDGAGPHHLTVTSHHDIYFTEAPANRVWIADLAGNKRIVTEAIDWPRGVQASADRSRLVVNEPRTKWVWTFQIEGDGSLIKGRRFCELETGGQADSDAGGMVFDSEGMLYVATKFGVQVCDQRGRVTAIIGTPGKDGVSNVFFAGDGLTWLYVTEWEKVYRRPVRRRGAGLGNAGKPR